MHQSHNNYHSFLIRIWRADGDEIKAGQWNFELESIQSGQKYRFPDMKAMLGYLERQLVKKQG